MGFEALDYFASAVDVLCRSDFIALHFEDFLRIWTLWRAVSAKGHSIWLWDHAESLAQVSLSKCAKVINLTNFFMVFSDWIKNRFLVRARCGSSLGIVWHLSRLCRTFRLCGTLGGVHLKKLFYGLWSFVAAQRSVAVRWGFFHHAWNQKSYLLINFHWPESFLKILTIFCKSYVLNLHDFLHIGLLSDITWILLVSFAPLYILWFGRCDEWRASKKCLYGLLKSSGSRLEWDRDSGFSVLDYGWIFLSLHFIWCRLDYGNF